jgi:hypothetical protein
MVSRAFKINIAITNKHYYATFLRSLLVIILIILSLLFLKLFVENFMKTKENVVIYNRKSRLTIELKQLLTIIFLNIFCFLKFIQTK